ncbi:MAG: PorT family protein [Paludibacteraceae bacterium]|nr:PorT family protein [Paludibacteraceae bacterium]
MKVKRYILVFILFAAVFAPVHAQQAMNRPYVDDKLFHFGFQLGLNFASYGITDSEMPDTINGTNYIYHARVGSILPGFNVGFISDLRLSRHLNLRFCPGMQFTSRTISYTRQTPEDEEDRNWKSPTGRTNSIDVLAIPVYLPLYLKWSAEREGNYRPYVIAGGGASFNVSRDREKPVLMNLVDYFAEIGFGCDLYFQWFKFCPEISYRIGFANQICPYAERHDNSSPYEAFYTNAISRMTNHCVCLTFNFE